MGKDYFQLVNSQINRFRSVKITFFRRFNEFKIVIAVFNA